MRLFARLLGTWLLAMTAILLVVDFGHWLETSRFAFTSLADIWTGIHADSLSASRAFIGTRFFGSVLTPVLEWLLLAPGWAVLAVPGIFLALAGRTRQARIFVGHDQI